MKHVESLEQHSNLIKEFKNRTSCKVPRTNCYLTPGEIGAYIADGNWSYEESREMLYFIFVDEVAAHLYYYAVADLEPCLPADVGLPVMADFVLRERETASFQEELFPLWERAGFLLYKRYQRMRYCLDKEPAAGPACEHIVMAAREEQAEKIRTLWKLFLDRYDNKLPSADETAEQIRKGNVVCCMHHGKICGAVFVEVNGRSGFIQHVTVHEEYRRQGMGEHMIKYLYGHMFQKGVTDFKLWVDVENVAAIKLYRNNGFKQDGVFSVKLLKG